MRKAASARRLLDRRIGMHDRLQFELKLEYTPQARQSPYVVEAFVCMPSSLNINPHTAPPEELYADIHNYVRLKTPELSWSELRALPDSPLVRACASALRVKEGADPGRFNHECRLYACIFRAALRDFADHVGAVIASRPGAAADLAEAIQVTVAGAAAVAADYRQLAPLVADPAFPESARSAYRLADEYASVSLEQQFRRAIVFLAKAAGTDVLRRQLLDVLLAEENYRRERGYPCIFDPGGDNEQYVYRLGLLKKYCSSVLFLQVHRHGARTHWQQVLAALAAGIAMAFATVIAFWAQARTETLGLRLFVILVVAYMFKDRIKEGARSLFSSLLERRFYDHRLRIEDPEGGTLGVCREKIEYLRPDELPEDVRAMRHAAGDPIVLAAEAAMRDTVYRYRKEVVLRPSRLHGRRGGAGVTDIVRFHVARLLHEMDEPYQEIQWVEPASMSLRPVRAAKVYHVDVVFRFTSRPRDPPAMTLMRLILDRRGIKKIERLDRPGASSMPL